MLHSNDKREKLLGAATDLIHDQGYSQTSLADISKVSGVPLGNVYYYFKTKDDLLEAVVRKRADQFRGMFDDWDQLPHPKQRLLAFLKMAEGIREVLTEQGCPIGSLCQELTKENTPLATKAGNILKDTLEWVSKQYQQLGTKDADELGVQFVASLQGGILLAGALNDSGILLKQLERLRRHVDEL